MFPRFIAIFLQKRGKGTIRTMQQVASRYETLYSQQRALTNDEKNFHYRGGIGNHPQYSERNIDEWVRKQKREHNITDEDLREATRLITRQDDGDLVKALETVILLVLILLIKGLTSFRQEGMPLQLVAELKMVRLMPEIPFTPKANTIILFWSSRGMSDKALRIYLKTRCYAQWDIYEIHDQRLLLHDWQHDAYRGEKDFILSGTWQYAWVDECVRQQRTFMSGQDFKDATVLVGTDKLVDLLVELENVWFPIVNSIS